MEHIGIRVIRCLVAMTNQDSVVRPKERPSSRIDRTENRLAQFVPVKNRKLAKHNRIVSNHFNFEPLELQ
jgi:hypothetical protein